jgi:hypothetical protein
LGTFEPFRGSQHSREEEVWVVDKSLLMGGTYLGYLGWAGYIGIKRHTILYGDNSIRFAASYLYGKVVTKFKEKGWREAA